LPLPTEGFFFLQKEGLTSLFPLPIGLVGSQEQSMEIQSELSPTTDDSSYKKTPRTRLKRRHINGSYDKQVVHDILDSGLVAHVGFSLDGRPIVTPTAYWRMGESIYFHGSSASRTLKSLGAGIPVCVTVSHLDGIVHARSGYNSCMNYRAVMIFGDAMLVTDPAEKTRCLDGLMDRLAPGRSGQSRPTSDKEMKATAVLRLDLNEVSAKVRAGGVDDDEADQKLDYWAGIVPVKTVMGEPVDDIDLRPGIARPENITQIRLGR
jgi:nitroimidazol reductase NimA-like FMN-containing flavoprotein (pyridoxamine 5'-phosphate oxidase superfamily)